MGHLLEVRFEKCLGGTNSNWNIQTFSHISGFDIGLIKSILQRFAGSVPTLVIGGTWIVSLPGVKDVVAFDCVLLPTTFLHCGRTPKQFAGH
jgi:hypothetical protein